MRLPILLLFWSVLTTSPIRAADGAVTKSKPDIVGWYYWELLNAPMQFLIKVSRDDSGRLRATSDNIARGDTDRPVSAVFYDPPNFLLEFDPTGALKGRLSDDGTKLEVVYQAGDFVFPSVFERVDPSRFPPEPRLTYTPEASGPAKLCGIWNGTMDWKGAKLRHVLRVGRAVDGSVRGKLDMIEQGERNIPLTAIRLTNSMARLECKPWEITYSGRLSEDGNKLEMKFESGTRSAAITFERATEPWRLEQPAVGATSPDLEGDWHGVMDMQSMFARIALRIGRAPDGSYRITQRSLDEPDPIPSGAVVVDFRHPELKCEWIGSDFSRSVLQVRLDPARHRLTGIWEAWGSPSPVSLERQTPRPTH